MSAVKNQPATALPFELVGTGADLKIIGADGSGVDAAGAEGVDQNIRYAVHTANAYPKLITALRTAKHDISVEKREGWEAIEKLLAELGELP